MGHDNMPVLFVGHGSPMNAIEDNRWSREFRALGKQLPRPRAVLAVSAHWFIPGTFLTSNEQPKTIHDFGGFPDELFRMQYPAPGDPALAERVAELLGADRAGLTDEWGLDHGAWSVLHHLLPDADVPVVQLSLDWGLKGPAHLELGAKLAPLRAEGVLILGSGNIVHNLGHAFSHASDPHTPSWAVQFDADVAQALERRDTAFLAGALDTDTGAMAHPTPDHYLPLLYAAGAAGESAVSFPITGFDMSSLSMRAALWA